MRAIAALQPANSEVARTNAARTLQRPVSLAHVGEFTAAEIFKTLDAHCREGRVYAWGVREERQWEWEKMISRPCVVLFRRDNQVYKVGQIRGFTISTDLADRLWQRDKDDEAWNHIYFLDDVLSVAIPISEVHAMIGRQPDSHWQALWTLSPRKSERVIDLVRSYLGKPPLIETTTPAHV
jgi:hypothetical protein